MDQMGCQASAQGLGQPARIQAFSLVHPLSFYRLRRLHLALMALSGSFKVLLRPHLDQQGLIKVRLTPHREPEHFALAPFFDDLFAGA